MSIRQLEALLRRVFHGADHGIDAEALRTAVRGEAGARRARREWAFLLGMAMLATALLVAWFAVSRGAL